MPNSGARPRAAPVALAGRRLYLPGGLSMVEHASARVTRVSESDASRSRAG